jgi:hypothetical protein
LAALVTAQYDRVAASSSPSSAVGELNLRKVGMTMPL